MQNPRFLYRTLNIRLLALAALGMTANASADTINLICTQYENDPSPWYIKVDLELKTISIGNPEPDPNYNVPATITDDLITWSDHPTERSWNKYTLNRSTGLLVDEFVQEDFKDQKINRNCKKDAKLF